MTDIWITKTLTSGGLSLEFLPGIGGRLWDVRFHGQSILFQNPDLAGLAFGLDTLSRLPTRSPQFGFPLWGGEKTWVAPDKSWVDGGPYKTLDSGPYAMIASEPTVVHMQSEVCPESELQIDRKVALLSGTSWSIEHSLTNRGASDRHAGVWSVLMLDRPAQIGLDAGTGAPLLPVFGDTRGRAQQHGTHAVIDCRKSGEFKLGASNPSGKAFVRLTKPADPLWLCCQTPAPAPGETYAHDRNFEVFNSGDYSYCEAEWHSPAQTLKPGERLSFQQVFHLRTESDFLADPDTTLKEMELLSCMS